MRKKLSHKETENRSLMSQIFQIIEKHGSKSLEQARKRLSAIKIENEEALKGLELYSRNWKDTIHPAILSLSYEAVSDSPFDITNIQIMILFLTAAMDIHDDVMDKSMTKGGKPTLYGEYGEDLAILIGDALLMEGFMMLLSCRATLSPESFDRMIDTVNNSLLEVGNAHLLELQLKRKTCVTPDEVLSLIEKKAAIFEGISEIGAIAGKASQDQVKVLREWGKAFGYLVMLREEFIDMFEPDELSSRLRNEYPPLPIIYAMEDPKVNELILRLKNKKITEKATQELINRVYKNKKVNELKKGMYKKAMAMLGAINTLRISGESTTKLATLTKGMLEGL